jgi:NADH:ubiquinone reductase (H+-translocating)
MDDIAGAQVIVVGGGYAGVLAANRLSGYLLGRARVMMVAPGPYLTDRIRLHEVAARGSDARRPYADLLAAGVQHVDARAVGLDRSGNRLAIDRGRGMEWLHYDALVLALGSQIAPAIPSSAPHALALRDVQSAQQLAAALKKLERGQRVIVVGGGLTSIELASEIADAHPRLSVELLAADFVPDLAGPARDALRAALQRAGVQLREGVAVQALSERGVQLRDGSECEASISVLAAGFRAAPLDAAFDLPTRGDGRIEVDAELRVQGSANVFVAGDLAAPPSAAIGSGRDTTRMACATAMPLGAHAADQIVKLLAGRALSPYHFGYMIRCISIGRQSGVVVSVDSDDRPTGRVINGRLAALIKELICRLVIGMLRLERLRAGSYVWPRARRRSALRLPA